MTGVAGDSTAGTAAGALFVVATPIGNLQDLSPRAAATLREVDLLLAEDTRHTRTLLEACGIARSPASIESLHEHNERERVPALVARLVSGERMALVTDAGTPLLSDPGTLLVAAASRAGIEVIAIPGPCAAIAALSIAGLATDRFVFEGFLPAKSAARREALAALAREARTLVFYEAPHRLDDTLADLAHAFGPERNAAVARELTKRFERVYRGTLASLAQSSAQDANMSRGEIVIIVAGAAPGSGEDDHARESERVLVALLAELPVSQAARIAAQLTGRSRKELYELALQRKGASD